MVLLNFPSYKFRFKSKENKNYIFDPIRKKFMVLQPEEWVRQHVLQYLHQQKGYPLSLINVEKKIFLNGLTKRYDIVVFNSDGSIHILVECKAPEIQIDQHTFVQIARYNLELNASYLMITNGLHHYYCAIHKNEENYTFLKDIPEYIR
jgi:hypothetical protein